MGLCFITKKGEHVAVHIAANLDICNKTLRETIGKNSKTSADDLVEVFSSGFGMINPFNSLFDDIVHYVDSSVQNLTMGTTNAGVRGRFVYFNPKEHFEQGVAIGKFKKGVVYGDFARKNIELDIDKVL